MQEVETKTPAVGAPPGRKPLFLAGAALFILGIGWYVVQFSLNQFVTPWYMPILGTAGVLLMILSAWQRRSVIRFVGVAIFVLVCGLEWFLVLGSRAPAYTGPAQTGRKLPSFTAMLAGGEPFTSDSFAQGKPSVLLFNRGRW